MRAKITLVAAMAVINASGAVQMFESALAVGETKERLKCDAFAEISLFQSELRRPEQVALLEPGFQTNIMLELQTPRTKTILTAGLTNGATATLSDYIVYGFPPSTNWGPQVGIGVRILREEEDGDKFNVLFSRCREYVRLRVAMHSAEYALNSVSNRVFQADGRPTTLFMMPSSEHDVIVPTGWPTKHLADGRIMLVDGGCAWLFKAGNITERRDALEYDESKTNTFRLAIELVQKDLKSEGRDRSSVSAWEFDRRLQAVVKERFGLKWMTPSELRLIWP